MLHLRRSIIGIVLCLTLLMMLLSGACDEKEGSEQTGGEDIPRDTQTPIVIPQDEPVIIGVSAALTGPIGPRGIEIRDAVIVGVERWKAENGEEISGHEIKVWAEDDGCYEAGCATNAANQLRRQRGLVGIIGPQCSSGAAESIPAYAEAGIVMISASATRADLTFTQPESSFFFRTVYSNKAEGIMQAQYVLSQLNAATVWIIDDSEAYGEDLADAAQGMLEESGREVTREHIVPGAVDFSELTAQIAADGPDAVIFEGFNPEGALLFRQLRDAGYAGPFISGDAVASVPNFVEPLGDQAEGVIFAGVMPPLPDELVDDYIDIIGHEPTTPFAAHAIDAVYILLDAVVEVSEAQEGSLLIDPIEFREAVRNPQLLVGLSGIIAFDENGDRVGNAETIGLKLGEVRNGEIALISP
ncbi:MAG: branched-chain amino acid ABC transporter substrate-binding protein [Chloroflexi bacterium]|nr:branched-chain amino acid ABC transporter substrate-binding protein [Chloroflexota bacterium]